MLEKENDHVKHTGVVLQLEMGASGNKISIGGGGKSVGGMLTISTDPSSG